MNIEDFKISPKHYATNNLTYILYNGVIIDSVEIYNDLFFVELAKDNWESQKKKRKPAEVQTECDAKIRRFISQNSK